MDYKRISAILKGKFLIEPSYAKANLQLIASILKREQFAEVKAAADPMHEVPKGVSLASNNTSVIYSIRPGQSSDRLPYGCIAMVDCVGPVFKYGDYCSYGSMDYCNLINGLAASDRVTGIILNIDSPGGEVGGTGTYYQCLKSASKIKPVLSIIQDGMAASAGYWIAAGTQEIYCTRATDMVGSIGAYSTLVDYTAYFEEMGIKLVEVYASKSVDKNKTYYDAIAGDTSGIVNELDFFVEDFINSIKSSRAGRIKEKATEPFSGKMYFANDAMKLGLIDGIKSLDQVVNRINQLIALKK